MFQGPKGYIAQTCEVHLQYGNSTTKWRFCTFFDLIPLYTYIIYIYSLWVFLIVLQRACVAGLCLTFFVEGLIDQIVISIKGSLTVAMWYSFG